MAPEDNELKPISPDNNAQELAHQALSQLSFEPIEPEEVDLSQATRLPVNELMSLGSGLMPLLEGSRSITQTVESAGKGLLYATDELGNPLDIAQLFNTKNGTGSLGAYLDANKRLKQARLHEVVGQATTVTTQLPVDPGLLLVAALLVEINLKLDGIDQNVQEMSRYIKDQDRSKLRGNLVTLNGLINSYRFNWDNETFRQTMHIKVMDIKQSASQQISLHRKEAGALVAAKPKKGVEQQLDQVVDEMGQYRLANYLYAFSTFTEVMLQENFGRQYLATVMDDLDRHSVDYIAFYTKVYDAMNAKVEGKLGTKTMDGIARTVAGLGKAVEQTPIGDLTQIDETLIRAGGSLDSARKSRQDEALKELKEMRSSEIRPFIDSLENIGELYNEPVMLLADGEAVYLLPVEG